MSGGNIPLIARDRDRSSLVVSVAAAAAILSGYSRSVAVATTRFIFALIISISPMGVAPHRIGLVVALIIAGGLWTALLKSALSGGMKQKLGLACALSEVLLAISGS